MGVEWFVNRKLNNNGSESQDEAVFCRQSSARFGAVDRLPREIVASGAAGMGMRADVFESLARNKNGFFEN